MLCFKEEALDLESFSQPDKNPLQSAGMGEKERNQMLLSLKRQCLGLKAAPGGIMKENAVWEIQIKIRTSRTRSRTRQPQGTPERLSHPHKWALVSPLSCLRLGQHETSHTTSLSRCRLCKLPFKTGLWFSSPWWGKGEEEIQASDCVPIQN